MFEFKEKYGISDLLKIMELLRGENGCPCDKVQTHESIRTDLIEEAYEVCEGIDCGSPEMLREELGDLLLQIVFHSRIEEEKGNFNFDDVCSDICQKLVYRHPHVFGEVKVSGSDEVLKNWDALKKESKKQETYTETLESIPKNFPSLLRGDKICRRAARANAANNDVKESADKIRALLEDLGKNPEKNETIIGKILLNICNISRILGTDSEKALTYAENEYIKRFKEFENGKRAEGRKLTECTEGELKGVSSAAGI